MKARRAGIRGRRSRGKAAGRHVSRCQTNAWSKTHVAQCEGGDGGNGMGQHPPAKDLDMPRAHPQVPQEVAQREALTQPAQARVSPDAVIPPAGAAPAPALLVVEDDVEREDADDDRLEEGHHVHIPVGLGAAVERFVFLRRKPVGEERADEEADAGVHGKGEDHLMDVQRQRTQAKRVGEGLRGLDQRPRRREGKWIEHGEQAVVAVVVDGGGDGYRMVCVCMYQLLG